MASVSVICRGKNRFASKQNLSKMKKCKNVNYFNSMESRKKKSEAKAVEKMAYGGFDIQSIFCYYVLITDQSWF
mgnify:CR=1 FL=1